jgi:HEAT repeat protein
MKNSPSPTPSPPSPFVSIRIHSWFLFLCLLLLALPTMAAERDAEAAERAALGDSDDLKEAPRPAKLPDLTKGDPMPPPPKGGYPTWNMGPTGIIGLHNQQNIGDQIRVISVRPGSPAEGKVIPGDVLLGVGGKRFAAGGHMGMDAGYAIIAAEEEANKGALTLHIWRDRNWTKRTGAQDMFAEDIEAVFKEAEDSADVYEWKGEEERSTAVKQMAFDKYPIDGVEMDITLRLKVMGTYSDNSPWDCPVVEKVREDAWKVIAEKFTVSAKHRRIRASWPDVLALVASGKPEYIALAKDWVRQLPVGGKRGLCMDMEYEPTIYDVTYGGMQSWHHGFNYLEMAIYYDATGDDYILPEVRRRAIVAALGQNGGGSWGHTFAFPHFNGGMLHKNNPGYGAMNNAGGRCFYLLALAKKHGIEHPEINAAIHRASKFFLTFVDKGCIPYGYHSPYGSDDSNGKNYGPAYAFYTLGKKYEAKYFSMHSAHASFTRRGGHASPTLWYYTPLAANIAGPKAVKSSMRNMRWFYTLSRNHDGSFVFLGDQSPGIGGKGMRNPTATVAMHLSAPLQQLMITGKDADENFWMTDEELNELLLSARGGQIKEPTLLEQIGKPWNERGSDELIDLLDHFYPNMRRALANELGKRYAAGEKDIVTKLIPRLSDDEARMREGACLALAACGTDLVLAHLSKVIAMLNDDAEFVRMTAAKTIGAATDPGDKTREVELLKAAAEEYAGMTADNGNVRNAVKGVILPRKRRGDTGPETLLTSTPFQAGYDETLVRNAFERIVTMDPQGTVPGGWDKEALLKLAGPVTFSADELQVNDAMFGGARKQQAQALLEKHGYREAIEGKAANLMKRSLLERSHRRGVQYKDSFITPAHVKMAPGLYRFILDDLRLWQQDDPIKTIIEKTGKGKPPITTPLNLLIEFIENDTKSQLPPSIAPDVARMFESELARAGDNAAQLALCREELKDLDRKNFFRKMAAMTQLAERLGPDAIDDVSPFLGHEQWRLRKHADTVAQDLIKQGAGPRLIALFKEAQARESGLLGNTNAAGILDTFAKATHKAALATAKSALTHHDDLVRGAAIKAVFAIGGDAELQTVLSFLQTATESEDFHGAEQALLSKRDATHVKTVEEAARKLLPTSKPAQRRSYAWLLGQFGGPENLATIQKAAATTDDDADLQEMIIALAYSPDRAASQTMMELLSVSTRVRDAVVADSVHRMVGRNGISEVSDSERVKFARAMLNHKYDTRLITYLGRVYTGPSVQLLFDVMKNGGENTPVAVEAIIACVEGMFKPSESDARIAAEVLTDIIEYIEVTQLRGGVQQTYSDKKSPYFMWKGLQSRAGQAMLRVHKPKKAPIPEFDDTDLDL